MKIVGIRNFPMTDYKKVVERGERLWNDTSLSTNGMSCGTCHPGGADLKMGRFPKYIKMASDVVTLDQMINFCMVNPMKAKPISWNHQNMTALAAYVKEHTVKEHTMGGMHRQPCAAK